MPPKKTKGKPKASVGESPKRRRARVSASTEPEVLPAETKKTAKGLTTKKLTPAGTRPKREVIEYDELLEAEESEADEAEDSGERDEEEVEAEVSSSDESSRELAPQNIDTALSVAGRAISPTDPLRRYLDEVRRYPLLSPEEEISLATRLHETGDLEAAKRLVQANLRLVVKIAFEYKSVYANVMDLIQEGNIGLMKAVSKYDPSKGAKVGYYSSWWIRSYILKYLLDNFRLVRVGTTAAQKKLFFHLMREKERLEAQGVFAGPKLLAEKLHVREKDVVEMEKRLGSSGSEVSLDAPMSNDGEGKGTFIDLLEDRGEAPDDTLAREQLLAMIRDRLPAFEKTLVERERRLLKDRILSEEPKTLQEVADHYGLTRERARQIESAVIQKLRDFLRTSVR